MRKVNLFTLAVAFSLWMVVVFLGGCQAGGEKQATRPIRTTGKENQEKPDGRRRVLMMGRSVMAGWFAHWGSDTSTSVKHGKFTLYYKELGEPPDIIDSVGDYLSEGQDKETVIFFKLCFADFVGGTKQEAEENLSENKRYVREVCDLVAKEGGFRLIIGNALPQVKNDTDSHLVRNNQQYNEYLEKLAEDYGDGVLVFDQYDILVDSEGNLKSSYAMDDYDSHLNEKAYTALDEAFFKLLEENF